MTWKDSKLTSLAFVSSLTACAKKKDLCTGAHIHADVRRLGLLQKDVYIGSALVNMYAKCGALVQAQEVLDEIPVRNVVSWNGLIAGYIQEGQGSEAGGFLARMCCEGILPDEATYVYILKACSTIKDLNTDKMIHQEILCRGLWKESVVLGNALINMYANFGDLKKGQQILDEIPKRDVVSWNSMIAGYAHQGYGQEALYCYQKMCSEGLSPSVITYVCILKACCLLQDAEMGKNIHDEIVNNGLLKANIVLGNAVIDMYAKCGLLLKAQEALDGLLVRDVVSWNTLLSGYTQHGHGPEALNCFYQMQSGGLSPDSVTYVCILKVCGITQDIDMGRKLHEEIASRGFLKGNVVLGNALVDMYVKCGLPMIAHKFLDELPIRDMVSWNALIAGYAHQGWAQEALCCFHKMQSEGLTPSAITYACALKACGMLQDVDTGQKIQEEIVGQGLLKKDIALGNALVDMYAKCGELMKAKRVLKELPVRDVVSWSALVAGYAQQGQADGAVDCFQVMCDEGISPNIVSWNALIGGYAQQGCANEALQCLELMEKAGIFPNAVTFVNVLNACSHSGLVNEGQMQFLNISERYGITPGKEHYACLVDLFARARLFNKAFKVIRMMPSDHPPVWSALLGACQKWGNVRLAKLAFEHAVHLNGCDTGIYVLLSNIYAAAGTLEINSSRECV